MMLTPTTFCKPEPWMERAKCKGMSELFFPPINRGQMAWREYKSAVVVCKGCSVTVPCLAYAFRHNELDHGVYGGKTPQERRRMLGKARKKRKSKAKA